MTLEIADRVRETTTTSGTGTISLAGAAAGFQTFVAGIGDGNTCHYLIVDGNNWEGGVGTVTSGSPDTLSRDTVIASSNSGSKITLSGSEATVSVTLPGEAKRAREAIQVDREVLTADRTYFVDGSSGSDSNDGLSSGSAFATIQKAIDTAAALDLSVYGVTIDIANGTYTGQNILKSIVGAGKIIIKGDEATPSNVLIQVDTNNTSCFYDNASAKGVFSIKGVKLQRSASETQTRGIKTESPFCKVEFQNVDFGDVSNDHILAQGGSVVQATGDYEISAIGSGHCAAFNGSFIDVRSVTVTVSNTPDSSDQFIRISRCSTSNWNGTSFSGSATGKRYLVELNGVLFTSGGGASFFPGDSAGSTATGGQYA